MLKAAKYLHAKFWQALAWLVILLAVLITGLRLWLPGIDLEPYQQEIERVAEGAAGMPLSIGAMQAQLMGARLALRFTDVKVLNRQGSEPLLHAPEVFVDIRLLRSLFSGRLQLGSAKVVGTKLKLQRLPDGAVTLQGLGEVSDDNPAAVAAVLLGHNHLRLFDTEIQIESAVPGRSPLRLSGVTVDLLNSGLRHQLSVVSHLGREGRERVRLIADLQQPHADALAMSGRFYLKCSDLVLGGRLSEWLPPGYRVDEGGIGVEVWGELRQGAIAHLRGAGELSDLRISGPAQVAPFELPRLSGKFDWRRQDNGWLFDLDDLQIRHEGETWPSGRLGLAWRSRGASEKLFHIQAEYLSLKGVSDFLAILELPDPDLHNALVGLSPEGRLTDLDFTLRQGDGAVIGWRLKGAVSGYSNRPWETVPGLNGLKLVFDGDQSGGWLKIDSSNLLVDFPQLFRQPLQATRAMGDFEWGFDIESGLHLQSDRLQMSNRDVQTLSRIDLQIPISGKDLFVDIQSDFWDADGSRKSEYLPVGVMPEELVAWLDKSVVSGYVKSGSFLLYGPVSEFPFREHQGRFEVWFGVEDLLLDYLPEWPRLSDAVAEVHFINNGLRVKLQDGLLLDSQLQDVAINIEQLKDASPVEIRGLAKGPFKDLSAILGDTPLRADFQPFVEAVAVDGQIRTQVDMSIPLRSQDPFRIDGAIEFDQASLYIKQADLKVDRLSGRLRFNQSAVEANGLEARVLDDEVSFDVVPHVHQGTRWTRISTRMPLDIARLQRQFPDWQLQHFEGVGEGDIRVTVSHRPSQVPVRLSLVSDLRGVSVNLPAPLGKQAQERRKLDLGADFRADQTTELRVRYGQQTHALFRLFDQREKPWTAAIAFAGKPLSLDGIKGVYMGGHLAALNADTWIAWLGRQATSGEGKALEIEMDLRVDQLTALGTTCPDTHFTYKNYADGYRVNLTSETVQGMMQVPGDLSQRPILGRFDYIKLNLEELAKAITGPDFAERKTDQADPRVVPALNLTVDKLYINDNPMGKGNITWSKEPDGITVNSLNLVGDSLDLSGQGYWRQTPRGHSTSLNLRMHTNSLGDLQQDLGLTTGIEKAPTDVKAELYWPTSPLEMGAEKLYGSIWLKVDKGQVNNVDPGVGRLIGLFSLNALGKRLALDFSDLFSKGLTFDSIEGNFTLNDGEAYTTDLLMQSSAATIDVRGRTGLSSRSYDQQVVVTPNVSATLPLFGALAVSPTVGVALAVTQQLFGKQFDRIARRTYAVTGSWDDPQFNQILQPGEEAGADTHMPAMPGDLGDQE